DASIVDGVASLMTFFAGLVPSGAISLDREHNLLGGAAPFYRCYLCADGQEISVGPLERPFYNELLEKIGAPASFKDAQNDASNWEERATHLADIFKTQSADYWRTLLE